MTTIVGMPPSTVIGLIVINPEVVGGNGEYILECPTSTRILSASLVGESAIGLWAVCLEEHMQENAPLELRRLWVLPGGRPLRFNSDLTRYLGTALLPARGGFPPQDWHLFSDASGLEIDSEPAQTYKGTLH